MLYTIKSTIKNLKNYNKIWLLGIKLGYFLPRNPFFVVLDLNFLVHIIEAGGRRSQESLNFGVGSKTYVNIED